MYSFHTISLKLLPQAQAALRQLYSGVPFSRPLSSQ